MSSPFTGNSGQYGYGSAGKQKRLRFMSYLVKGLVSAGFLYGAGAAAGVWGGAAAGGGGTIGAAGGAIPGLEGLGAGGASGATLGAQGGAFSTVGQFGAPAAGSAASGLGWQDYMRMGMKAKDAMGEGQAQPGYQPPRSEIEMMDVEPFDEKEQLRKRASLLRQRIAELRSMS